MIGHVLGGAGAIEAVACVKSIQDGVIHPTINYEHPDPECDLDYVPNEARQDRRHEPFCPTASASGDRTPAWCSACLRTEGGVHIFGFIMVQAATGGITGGELVPNWRKSDQRSTRERQSL